MTLNLNPFLRYRKAAYQRTFDNPEGKKVLADLRRFCGATAPTADVSNVNATYMREGRREVYLRIMHHLNLTDEQVMRLVEDYPED
jgi:hypothetical protein